MMAKKWSLPQQNLKEQAMETPMPVDVFIRKTIEGVRDAGVPDFLNRWSDMTPEALKADIKQREKIMAAAIVGPKEIALRKQRERDFRIPKGFTDAEGKDYIERLNAERRKATMDRISKILKPKERNVKSEDTISENTVQVDEQVADKPRKAKAKAKAKAAKAPAKAKAKALAKAKKTARVAAKAKAKPAARKSGESKTAMVGQLLHRKEGCTTADVLELTGWPTVSMPAMAENLGIKLRKVKEGRTTHYFAA